MSTYDPAAGFTGTPDPTRWAESQAIIAAARQAAGGASLDIFPAADFAFVDRLTGDPILAEALEDIATVTRASKAWSMGWDGTNGGLAGALIEHASGKAAWSPYGLRAGPSAENLIPNPRGEGGAAPSTMPTGWLNITGAGVTLTYVGKGVANGWPYVDFDLNGTAAAPGAIQFSPTLTAAAGETFTLSAGAAVVAGTVSGSLALFLRFAAGEITSQPIDLTSAHRRWFARGSVPSGQSGVLGRFWWNTGTVFTNARIRIFTPVLTKTDYLTHPVLPPVGTPGASVKAIDSVSVPVNLGWYRHDEGTLVVDYRRPTGVPSGGVGLVSLPDPANTVFGRCIRYVGADTARAEATTSSGTVVSSETVASAVGRHVVALRWAAGGAHKVANDGVLGAGFIHAAAVAVPTVMNIGRGGFSGVSTTPSSTPLQRIRFFPRALSDAELQAITTPHWSA